MDGFGKLFFFAIVCYCCCSLRVVGTARVDKTDGIPFRCLIPTPSIHRKKTYHTDGSLYFSVSIYSKRGYLQFNIRRASLAEYDNTVKWESETGIFFFGAGKVIGKLNRTVEEEGFAHFRIHSPFLLLLFHYFISIRQSTKGY
jgi:hypothetical protein